MSLPEYRFVHVGVCLPTELRSRLQDAARREGLPVSTYARLLIASHLDAAEDQRAAELEAA